MTETWVLFTLIGMVGGHFIARFFLKRKRLKKIAALDRLELSLPTEVPSTCPKCGYAGRKAKTGEPYSRPDRPAFRPPCHVKRLESVDSPEHLRHICHECQFAFRTAAGEA